MNRSELFEILHAQYEIERGRYDNLHSRAQETLKIAGVAAAIFALFVGREILKESTCSYQTMVYAGGIIFLVASVLLAMIASATKPYREIVDIETIAVEADEKQYSKEDVYSIMLANMADCSTHNKKLMDQGFSWLSCCRIAMAIGILLVTIGIFF